MILAALALAAAPTPPLAVGMGTKSCGSWTEAARDNGGWPRAAFEAWLAGFVSGVNLNIAATVGNLNDGTDFDGMVAWIDNYCAANPLSSVSSATVTLSVELLNRKHAR